MLYMIAATMLVLPLMIQAIEDKRAYNARNESLSSYKAYLDDYLSRLRAEHANVSVVRFVN